MPSQGVGRCLLKVRDNRGVKPLTHHPVPSSDQGEIEFATLPPGWVSVTPRAVDAADLLALLRRHEVVAHGRSSSTRTAVDTEVSATGMQTRRHVLLRDETATARAWATVHDRAAGRVLVSVLLDPALETSVADEIAGTLFAWTERASTDLALDRGVDVTQMDSGAFNEDLRQQRWLARAGFAHTATWLQMSRPVTPAKADQQAPGELDPNVVVRRVRRAGHRMPDQEDLETVYSVLEKAFTDHFNYHYETFDEFFSRLREDPGHRWDHWWIAEVIDGSKVPRPAGVLVATVLPGHDNAPAGSYVAYLGVLRSARGTGVARSLLNAVIVDAAERGRDRVGLEVDADSSTGAVDLYTSTGFHAMGSTQSWHRDLSVGETTSVGQQGL
jgi:ribosomal protein S18 acetylase RimI-like enzyme